MLKPLTSRNIKIITLIVIVFIVIFSLIYLYIWRSASNDYEQAIGHSQTMSSAHDTVDEKLQSISTSTDINDNLVSTLEKAAGDYKDNLTALENSTVVRSDSSVKAIYNQHKQSLTAYVQSSESLVASMKKYRSLLITCTELISKVETIATEDAFDDAAKDCKAAVEGAKPTSSNPFDEQFLSEYVPLAEKLLTAYRQVMVKADSGADSISFNDISRVEENINTLSNKEIDLSLKAPTNSLNQINMELRKQKSAVFR
jgi:hypothetical protein